MLFLPGLPGLRKSHTLRVFSSYIEEDLTILMGYLEPIVLPGSLCGRYRLDFPPLFWYFDEEPAT